MVNMISGIMEEHMLMTIFLICLAAIISCVAAIRAEYASTPYYSEIVKYEIVIIFAYIISAITAILKMHHRN